MHVKGYGGGAYCANCYSTNHNTQHCVDEDGK